MLINITAGAAAVPVLTHDRMVIAGGVLPACLEGEEAPLRAAAFYFQDDENRVCMISCDNLMMERSFLDSAAAEIERRTGIPFSGILISATHTHHAPSMMRIHGYDKDTEAVSRFFTAIVTSAEEAVRNARECSVVVDSAVLDQVGQNSRLRLENGQILWVPQAEKYSALPATGPYDPELTVCSLSDSAGRRLVGALFNHSCHNIGSRSKKRSPGFYGLAARELEEELGGVFGFFSGAAGSTHDFTRNVEVLADTVKKGVRDSIAKHHLPTHSPEAHYLPTRNPITQNPVEQNRKTPGIWAVREEFEYTVRMFDEQKEDAAVRKYCTTMDISDCGTADEVIRVFQDMRRELRPLQGETRKTWLQVLRIGELCIVGLPGEIFASLGMEIKKRSPWKHTIIIELANDSIGYVPDSGAWELGGYQLWTGFHSLLAEGTGERMVEAVLELLSQ